MQQNFVELYENYFCIQSEKKRKKEQFLAIQNEEKSLCQSHFFVCLLWNPKPEKMTQYDKNYHILRMETNKQQINMKLW